jgi:hypothetical protein
MYRYLFFVFFWFMTFSDRNCFGGAAVQQAALVPGCRFAGWRGLRAVVLVVPQCAGLSSVFIIRVFMRVVKFV